MPRYYANANTDVNVNHEVHTTGCSHPPPNTIVGLWVSILPAARRQRLQERSLAEELMDSNGVASMSSRLLIARED